jgi:hypothetical protein
MLYVQHTYSFFGFRMEDKSIPPLKDVGFVCPPYLPAAKALRFKPIESNNFITYFFD